MTDHGVVLSVPEHPVRSHRTGSLSPALTVAGIKKVLIGIPEIDDDPDKVDYSWSFIADGHACGIWDYKGCRWSTYGPREILLKLFGEHVE